MCNHLWKTISIKAIIQDRGQSLEAYIIGHMYIGPPGVYIDHYVEIVTMRVTNRSFEVRLYHLPWTLSSPSGCLGSGGDYC